MVPGNGSKGKIDHSSVSLLGPFGSFKFRASKEFVFMNSYMRNSPPFEGISKQTAGGETPSKQRSMNRF